MKQKKMLFFEFSCFFYDPVDVGRLISGSSAFSKSSLYIWTFSVHILLKPSLKDFEHYLISMWNECNSLVLNILWLCPSLGWNENWPFPVLWPLPSFQICWHIECGTLAAASFRIWNSSARILSPPLALFVVMFPSAYLTSHSRMPGSRWVTTPLWLSGSLRTYLYSSSVYSCHLFLISSAYVMSVSFLSCFAHLCMKCSTSNFLEESSSLSHFIVFLYFFALFT